MSVNSFLAPIQVGLSSVIPLAIGDEVIKFWKVRVGGGGMRSSDPFQLLKQWSLRCQLGRCTSADWRGSFTLEWDMDHTTRCDSGVVFVGVCTYVTSTPHARATHRFNSHFSDQHSRSAAIWIFRPRHSDSGPLLYMSVLMCVCWFCPWALRKRLNARTDRDAV